MNAGHCMCILLRLRKKAVNEYCKVGATSKLEVVKAGCRWQLSKGLSRMSGNRPVRFLWGLGPVTDPGYQTSAASVMKPMIIGKIIIVPALSCPA